MMHCGRCPFMAQLSQTADFSRHDDIPAIYELPEGGEVKVHRPGPKENLRLYLNEKSRYWIKAGSVGGPYRDGTPVANSVLYDSEEQTITMLRIPYDTKPLSEALSSHRFHRNLPTIKNRSRFSGSGTVRSRYLAHCLAG